MGAFNGQLKQRFSFYEIPGCDARIIIRKRLRTSHRSQSPRNVFDTNMSYAGILEKFCASEFDDGHSNRLNFALTLAAF